MSSGKTTRSQPFSSASRASAIACSTLKVTSPDGKDFQLFFDKASGLPVRVVAKVLDYQGNEYTQETTFGEYKSAGGIQHPTKITSRRDGEKYVDVQVGEFKTLEKVDPGSFEQPK